MPIRHDGRVGARPETNHADDAAYQERTFVAPSRAGAVVLPSEAFLTRGETVTRGEWERRHAATYPTGVAAA
jgi:hypothetical protein